MERLWGPPREPVTDRAGTAGEAVFDLAVVGGGVAGLAAALRGAGDGARVVLLERTGLLGGQVRSVSRVETVLGLPVGLTGVEFVSMLQTQAQRFGAEIRTQSEATRLSPRRQSVAVTLSDGAELTARSVVIATGGEPAASESATISAFPGAGVYCSVPKEPAAALAGQAVFLTGEAPAMAEAALRLSRHCRTVVLVTAEGRISDRISTDAVRQLRAAGNVVLRPHTEILDAGGVEQLETLVLRDRRTGRVMAREAAALFLLHRVHPRSDWVGELLERDENGFVLTGSCLLSVSARSAGGAGRMAAPMETSLARVFAAGEVRSGSERRIGAVAEEGIAAARQAIQAVRERDSEPPVAPTS